MGIGLVSMVRTYTIRNVPPVFFTKGCEPQEKCLTIQKSKKDSVFTFYYSKASLSLKVLNV